MSYTHQEFIIDLTQVTASAGPNSKVSAPPRPVLPLFPTRPRSYLRPLTLPPTLTLPFSLFSVLTPPPSLPPF